MIRVGDRVQLIETDEEVKSLTNRILGRVTATDGRIARVRWDLLRGSPDYVIECKYLEVLAGIQPNERYPRYSENTCAMLRIPVKWAGVPMHACRFRTILANK